MQQVSLTVLFSHSYSFAWVVDKSLRSSNLSRYLYNEGSKGLLLCSNGILMKKLGETLVSVLLGSIVANKSNAQVVEICLALFGIFGGNEDFCAFVSRSTSVREIISLMDHHPGNRDVQKNACFALHKLAVSPDLSSQIQAQDGVSKVFGVMDVFQQDADVQIVGCLAIRNMSSNLTNLAHTLSSAFNIERLINVMRFHGYSGDAVVAACTALGHLSANCKESSLDACRQGGVAALQQVMQIHGDCHTVQLAALTCLRTLSTAANNQSTIAEKSVFVTVMKSMTRHMNSKHLVSEACRFLANAGRQGNTILDAITDANCLEILLAALGFYSAYPDVEELMVTALYSLAYRSPDCQVLECVDRIQCLCLFSSPFVLSCIRSRNQKCSKTTQNRTTFLLWPSTMLKDTHHSDRWS